MHPGEQSRTAWLVRLTAGSQPAKGSWLGITVAFVDDTCIFAAELWEYGGTATWVFVTLGVEDSEEIEAHTPPRTGFGSVRVSVRIGDTEWKTSVFPDSSSGSYVLPVKRAIRDKEGIDVGDVVEVHLKVLTG